MLMLKRQGCVLLGNRLRTRYLITPLHIQCVVLEMDIVASAVLLPELIKSKQLLNLLKQKIADLY